MSGAGGPPAQPPARPPAQSAAQAPGRPVKHSLTLHGHRTSVSLEDAFWNGFRRLAEVEGKALNQLAKDIDEARGDIGLASAIRVAVLDAALSGRLRG